VAGPCDSICAKHRHLLDYPFFTGNSPMFSGAEFVSD
jgi:hypothetical protein